MSYKVVVIQTSPGGYENCKIILDSARLPDGSLFITMDPISASRWLEIDKRQLLITGSFKGDQDAADSFVRRMKMRNPRLVVANFASLSSFGDPYDMTIPQFSEKIADYDGSASLIAHIKAFLSRLVMEPTW